MKKILMVLVLVLFATNAFAEVDVVIKGVPEEAVENVKQMAAVAVDRHLKMPLVPEKALVDDYNQKLETFLKANDMWKEKVN